MTGSCPFLQVGAVSLDFIVLSLLVAINLLILHGIPWRGEPPGKSKVCRVKNERKYS